MAGFRIETFTILAPGVVIGRAIRSTDRAVNRFRGDDLGLADGFMKDCKIETLFLIEEGDFALGIFANGDLGLA